MKLGYIWRAASNTCDFETLQIYGHEPKWKSSVLIDVLQFDIKDVTTNSAFQQFQVANATFLAEAVPTDVFGVYSTLKMQREEFDPEDVRVSSLPPTVRKLLVRNVAELRKSYMAASQPGHTFVWELFAGKLVITRLGVQGGHFAGQPLELELGVNIMHPDVIGEIINMVNEFKP